MDAEIEGLVPLALAEHRPGKSSQLPSGDVKTAAAQRTLSLCPHDGFVVLDKLVNGTAVATHRVALERITLQGHAWCIEFDSDGFRLIAPTGVDSEQHEPIVLEAQLQFQLMSLDDASLVIMHRENEWQMVHLPTFMQRWSAAALVVALVPNSLKVSLDVAEFRWPRCGARIAVSAKSSYDALALTQYNGQQWRWVVGSCRRWKKHMVEMGLGEHILATGGMEELRVEPIDPTWPALHTR